MSSENNSKKPNSIWLGFTLISVLLVFAFSMAFKQSEDPQFYFYSHMQNESTRVEFALHDVRDYERWIKADEQKFVDAQGQTLPISKWPAEDREKLEELKSALLKAKARYNSFAYEYNQLMEREGFKFTTVESLPKGQTRVLPRKFDSLPTH